MKRVITLILCVALLACIPMFAFADGSGNINNGGGSGIGDGSGDSYWNDDDGVRVTVVRASDNKPVSVPIDLTNYNEAAVKYYFKKSKLYYKNGSHLQAYCNSYKSTKPSKALPKIIMESGNANIAAIRRYFCSSESLKKIAQIIGTTYEKLTDGKYKLLLEPIAYFYFNGYKYAMTATEAALYDEALSGGLRAKMVSLTHQQLPLSMFLEHADLGYPAFHGNRSGRQSDSTIIAQLGLGIVKFKDDGSDDGDVDDAIYRCNTDVITSVTLSSGSEINPDNSASVTFSILGGSYTVTHIVIPAGESQLVWVKWHTPSTPQKINIDISSSDGTLSADSITAKIVSLSEKAPPNPTATDRNDNFKNTSVPNKVAYKSNSWSVWNAEWITNWVWNSNWIWISNPRWESGGKWVDAGHWVADGGYWKFYNVGYSAILDTNMSLFPDDKDPTAQEKQMKSGYGIKVNLSTGVDTAVQSWVTCAQTAITYFPEFSYTKYWRILDRSMTDGLSAIFEFRKNQYSTYNRRVHFTPVWYPDGTYTAYTYLEDIWTPAGMLSVNLTDSTQIKGSVFDDWHVGPKLVN